MSDVATQKREREREREREHIHAGYVITKIHGTVKTVMKEPAALALQIEIGGSSSYRMEVKFLPGYMSHPMWQSS